MFAKAKAAAASAALAAKQAAEDADRRYGISTAVAGATEQAASVAEQAASVAEQAAERVDMDRKRAFLSDGVARVTTKATAFLEESLAAQVDLCYVTQRLVAMPMPGPPPNTLPRLSRDLHAAHGTHYMVWNLSEVAYDYTAFNDQVLEFRFPGHPAPPLELLVRICNSVENWLAADAENVAVVHCRTGKRRTCTVMACLMAWLGAAPDPLQALQVVAQRREIPISSLTIPSQRRYIRYFDRVLRGDKPDLLPKYCQRIMVNTIPDFSDHDAQPEVGGGGCCAELQLLQNGRLLWCSSRQAGSPCKFAPSDGCMSFPVDMELTADVVLRCSHVRAVASGGHQAGQASEVASVPTADVGGTDTHEHLSVNVSGGGEEQQSASDAISGASQFERMPMWRTAFNAGYVQAGLLRLTREELDGIAPDDKRYDSDFFVDVIFRDDDDGDNDDNDAGSADPGDQVSSQVHSGPSPSSIWQHVDQRKAEVTAGGTVSTTRHDQQANSDSGISPSQPSTRVSAESANFTIDFDEDDGVAGSGSADGKGGEEGTRECEDRDGDDPAAQWLGKVEAFEAFSGQHAEKLPPRIPSPTAETSTAAPGTDVGETQDTPPTTPVEAALAAALAAADDASVQKAARMAAMAPVPPNSTENRAQPSEKTSARTAAAASVQGLASVASSANGIDTTTHAPAGTTRTASDDSFDNWLDDDDGVKEQATRSPVVEDSVPIAAAPAPAAAPAAIDSSAPDDLDDFMASLDDL